MRSFNSCLVAVYRAPGRAAQATRRRVNDTGRACRQDRDILADETEECMPEQAMLHNILYVSVVVRLLS